MILYGNSLSPFVRKVLAFAHEKGIDLTLERVGVQGGGAEFAEASPFGKMPALRHPGADGGKDFCLADSSAIVSYLEALRPEPNLIPTEPMARGRTIWFDEFADTIFFSVAVKCFFNRFVAPRVLKREGDEAAAAHAEAVELPPLFAYLEAQIPDSGFLVEDRMTLADLAVASPFVNLGHVNTVIDPARFPKTLAYVESILSRPSFAPIVAAERRFVAAMA